MGKCVVMTCDWVHYILCFHDFPADWEDIYHNKTGNIAIQKY